MLRDGGFYSTGAAEDGRAPTEELSFVRALGLLFDGAAGDGPGPTKSFRVTKINLDESRRSQTPEPIREESN